jgi:hypothetical protein
MFKSSDLYISSFPSLINFQETTTLSWEIKEDVFIDYFLRIVGIGDFENAKGDVEIQLNKTTSFQFQILTIDDEEIVLEKRLEVRVAPPESPRINFYASKNPINLGEEFTLYWNVEGVDVTAIEIIDQKKFLPPSGNLFIPKLEISTTYILKVSTFTAEYFKQVELDVIYPKSTFVESFTASRTSVNFGETIDLAWNIISELTTPELNISIQSQYREFLYLEKSGTLQDLLIEKDEAFEIIVKASQIVEDRKSISILVYTPKIVSFESNFKEVLQNEEILLSWETENRVTELRLVSPEFTETVTGETSFITNTPASFPVEYTLRAFNEIGEASKTLTLNQIQPIEFEILSFNAQLPETSECECIIQSSGSIDELYINDVLLEGYERNQRVIRFPIQYGFNDYTLKAQNRIEFLESTITVRGTRNPQIVSFTLTSSLPNNEIISNAQVALDWEVTGDFTQLKVLQLGLVLEGNSGREFITLSKNTILTLEVQSDDGNIYQDITVQVTQPPQITLLSASSTNIRLGEPVTLSWNTIGKIDRIFLNKVGYLSNTAIQERKFEFIPTESGEYEMIAYNNAGEALKSISIRVNSAPIILFFIEPTWEREKEIRISWEVQPTDARVFLYRNEESVENLSSSGEITRALTLQKEKFRINATTQFFMSNKELIVEILNNDTIVVSEPLP